MIDQELSRASIINLVTTEVFQPAFNPQQLTVQITANYNRAASIGGTGARMHFGSTSNFTLNLDLYMDHQALLMENPDDAEITAQMTDAQKFLLSLIFPVGKQNDPVRRAPPKVLFIWPGIAEMPVRVISESFNFQKLLPNLFPWIYRVPIVLESDLRGERITSDVIRIRGFQLAGYGA
jgi:hypothetical protein